MTNKSILIKDDRDMITYNKEYQQFNLLSANNQLSLGVLPSGHLVFYYFGPKIGNVDLRYVAGDIKRASYLADTDGVKDFKLEQLPLVYPAYGNPDLRTPAFQLSMADGSRISNFRYQSHKITKKNELKEMPSTQHTNAETLMIQLYDEAVQLKLQLYISVFPEYDVFTQNVALVNESSNELSIERMMSGNLDFLTDKFELLTLGGAWGRETHYNRRKLYQGFQGVDSKRGASGHGQNPFIALLEEGASENQGAIYSMNLVYSGNFLALADVDMHQNTRMQIGINPFEFSWRLKTGATFETPEVVMVYANRGLNQLSQRYHHFYTDCLIPKTFANKVRPILMNNWEATYFDFDKETILALAKEGRALGMELFVLDDGWFGKRDSDDSSLGDWQPNSQKLGGSLTQLISEINQIGLDFGLWLEPEMVSPESDLYRAHPNWIIRVANQEPQQIRHQYVLDLSKEAVQEYIIHFLDQLLSENNISYLKWDMNRNITDSGSDALGSEHQKELSHRYILGLYRILKTITQKYPQVLLESCAGGGGRFDPGMLAYSPQIWTSDDTDAIERLSIQKGISLIYPQASMSCHVSAVPNHQVGRITSLNTRVIVAQQGNFGYELNLLELSSEEKDEIKEHIQEYKHIRNTMQFGKWQQLSVYDEQNEYAWQQSDEEKVIVSHVFIRAKANTVPKRLKLISLTSGHYRLKKTKQVYTDSELMQIGLPLPKATQDYFASRWILEKISD